MLVARIGVDDGERRVAGYPAAVPVGHRADVRYDAREDAKSVLRQCRDHDRQRRLVEILPLRRANAEADGADPVLHPGGLAQEGDDVLELRGIVVGDVEEAKPVLRRERAARSEEHPTELTTLMRNLYSV